MERKLISHKKRKVILVISIIAAIIIVFIIASYIVIHSYINKINIVTAPETPSLTSSLEDAENIVPESQDLDKEVETPDPQTEEVDPDIPEASEKEVNTIEEDIHENLQENSIPIKYDKNVFHILLIGSDTRKEGGSGRSDAMMLVSVNKKKKSITITSLLRDIYLQIPGKKNNRINAAYAFGGADLLMETIEQNFKLPIDQYASVDFYAFIDVVDAVGGVTLEVTEKEIPVMNNYINEINLLTGYKKELDCLAVAGTQLLNGKQALGYVRNRYVGNNDFDRTLRQRKVLKQIFNQVKNLNLVELTELLNIILPQVTTNISEGELLTLILSLPAYINYDFEQWSIPVSGSYSSMRIRGMSVLGIDFEENIKELHSKIYEE